MKTVTSTDYTTKLLTDARTHARTHNERRISHGHITSPCLFVTGQGGLLDAAEYLNFMPGFNLEGFPNRDSTIYTDAYGINDAHTSIREAIRYKISSFLHSFLSS
ncbi:hypothetical protein DPMN_028326 [Dreissena polymorpha]|uniref:Saccharopine dehydrogenase-like C-terminal domain-containing protein n=1 Tax=Dreissena polymorpha TaxID=45954 RepID=A0A9D4LX33_DREPO|nr:hypothetical protein DPMN_028326 [Dreissena polymorpha]